MTSSKTHFGWRYVTTKLGAQIVAILVVAALAYAFGISIPVVAAALTIFMTIFTLLFRGHFAKKQMIGLIWFTVAALTVCILFIIREYVSPIRVTQFHLAVLLLPPLLLLKNGKKPKQ